MDQRVDDIVVPSQPSMRLEGVVGGQVKDACGKELLLELKQYKNINISEIANSYNKTLKELFWLLIQDGKKILLKSKKKMLNIISSNLFLSCMEKAQDFWP